ncbi:MAG: SIMPL domain-containing protein [Candidatus Thiodiazotropha sp.]
MLTWFKKLTGLLIIAVYSTQPAFSDQQTLHYNQINLSAYAAMEVDNDIQIAVLYAQKEGGNLNQLTDQVNRLVSQAVQQVKQHPAVKVSTLGYQTAPRYQQQQLIGWRVRQEIRLESDDNQLLSELLGKLQSSMALQSIRYEISTKQRLVAEEKLTKQAINAFRARAEQITQQMGSNQYRLVEMSLQTTDQQPQPYTMRATMMALEHSTSAPTLEAGSQNLKVEVNGRIELQLD